MQQAEKYLYLPLEIVIREHDGKTTLAHEAVSAGWNVVLGPKIPLYAVSEQLPEGVFLIKSATPNELGQIRTLKAQGHKVCSLDEEGVVTFREFLQNNVRYSGDTISEIDRIFFWGDVQRDIYNEVFPDFAEKGHVTGSPRLEFWRDFAGEAYQDIAAGFREKYGNYILLPSSFGIGNNVLGAGKGLQLTKDHSRGLSKELSAFMTGQAEQNLIAFREYIDFLPDIARHFPDTNFVIRPHPSESHEAWEELTAGFENLHLVYEGSVTPWILGAAAIFHFKSTTSIEAHIMGRRVVTYVPALPPYMKKYELDVPLAVSKIASSREELLSYFEEILGADNHEVPPGPIEGVLTQWISTQPDQSSAARLMAQFEALAPKPTRQMKEPQLSGYKAFRAKVEGGLTRASDVPAINSLLPRRVKARIDGLNYGARKYLGLDIEHTRKIVSAIEKKSGSSDGKINVSPLTDNLFLLQRGG